MGKQGLEPYTPTRKGSRVPLTGAGVFSRAANGSLSGRWIVTGRRKRELEREAERELEREAETGARAGGGTGARPGATCETGTTDALRVRALQSRLRPYPALRDTLISRVPGVRDTSERWRCAALARGSRVRS